jgi:hypothetical protein
MDANTKGSIAGLILACTLSGCATYRNTTQVQDGPGLEFKATELKGFRDNQEKVLEQLYGMAGVTPDNVGNNGNWDRVIQGGMDYADSRCEAYMHALFRLNRDKKTVMAQVGLTGTAVAGLMAAAESAAKEVAAVAVLFGLASSSVDNLSSNLLYDLDPSSVRTLVKALQATFRERLELGYSSRPAALRVIRGYAMLCVPANIEAEVNLAVKRSEPIGEPGNAQTGQPPQVSNAAVAVPSQTAKLDANSALLREFVFPNGRLNAANRAELERILRSKGINADVSSFNRLERFAADRAEAVKALKLK